MAITIKMTPLGIYEKLRRQYLVDYAYYFDDDYAGQNKLIRMANIFAVENTKGYWSDQ